MPSMALSADMVEAPLAVSKLLQALAMALTLLAFKATLVKTPLTLAHTSTSCTVNQYPVF